MKRRITTLLLCSFLLMSCIGFWVVWPIVLVGSAPRELDEISMAMWTRPSGRAWYLDNLARQPRLMEQGRLLNWCLGANEARYHWPKPPSKLLVADDLESMKPGDDLTRMLALAVGREVDPSQYGDPHIAWAFVRVGFWDIATDSNTINPENFFFAKKYLGWIARLDEESRISAIMLADIDAMIAIVGDVRGDSVFLFQDPYDAIHEFRYSVIKILEDILTHSRDRKITLKQWCDRYRRSVAMHWLAHDYINNTRFLYDTPMLERFRTLTAVDADWDFFKNDIIGEIDQLLGNAEYDSEAKPLADKIK